MTGTSASGSAVIIAPTTITTGGGGGSPSGPCACGITDTFDRANQSGLGTSDAGIDWSGDMSPWSISSNTAHVGPITNMFKSGILVFDKGADTATVTCQITSFSTDDPDVIYVYLGFDTTSDFAEVHLQVNGTVTLATVAGNVFGSAGVFPTGLVKLKINITGTTAQCKVWDAAATEPVGWLLTNTVAAETAIDGYIGLAATPGTASALFNDYDVVGIDKCAQVQFDTFDNRTLSGSWGTTSSGDTTWTFSHATAGHPSAPAGPNTTCDVSSGLGQLMAGYVHIGGSDFPQVADNSAGLPTTGSQTVTMKFKFPTIGPFNGLSLTGFFVTVLWAANFEVQLVPNNLITEPGGVALLADSIDSIVKRDWVADAWYMFKLNYDAVSTALDLKFWAASDPEPAAYQMHSTLSSGLPNSAIDIAVTNEGNVNDPALPIAEIDIDYIDVEFPGRQCFPCTSSVIDDWERADQDEWGTSTEGAVWPALGNWGGDGAMLSVVSGQGWMNGFGDNWTTHNTLPISLIFPNTIAVDVVQSVDEMHLEFTMNSGSITARATFGQTGGHTVKGFTLSVFDGTNSITVSEVSSSVSLPATVYITYDDSGAIRAIMDGASELVAFLSEALPGPIATPVNAQNVTLFANSSGGGNAVWDNLRYIDSGGCIPTSDCITDSFNRSATVSPDGGLGTSDAGIDWVASVTNPAAHVGHIQSQRAYLDVSGGTSSAGARLPGTMPFPFEAKLLMSEDGQGTAFPTDPNANHNFYSVLLNGGAITASVEWIDQEFNGRTVVVSLTDGTNTITQTTNTGVSPVDLSGYNVSFSVDADNVTWVFSASPSDGPYTVSRLDATPSPIVAMTSAADFEVATYTTAGLRAVFDTLDISGLGCDGSSGGTTTTEIQYGPIGTGYGRY